MNTFQTVLLILTLILSLVLSSVAFIQSNKNTSSSNFKCSSLIGYITKNGDLNASWNTASTEWEFSHTNSTSTFDNAMKDMLIQNQNYPHETTSPLNNVVLNYPNLQKGQSPSCVITDSENDVQITYFTNPKT